MPQWPPRNRPFRESGSIREISPDFKSVGIEFGPQGNDNRGVPTSDPPRDGGFRLKTVPRLTSSGPAHYVALPLYGRGSNTRFPWPSAHPRAPRGVGTPKRAPSPFDYGPLATNGAT
jgi:hypothetical protein